MKNAPAGLEDILRLVVRLVLFPYMNLFGAAAMDPLYLLDKLSPAADADRAAVLRLGYLRGPHLRALVHGNIRLARRKQNRKERKARRQRAAQAQQKKELI